MPPFADGPPPKPAIIQPAEHWMRKAARIGRMLTEPLPHRLPGMELGDDLARYAGRPDLANFLPGWAPAAHIAGGQLTAFTFITSGTGSGSTITIPSAAAGDLAIIGNARAGGTGDGTPTDFAQLISTSVGSSGRLVLSWKKLLGTETTVTGLTSNTLSWIVAIFRPNGAWTTATANAVSAEGTTSNPTSQTIVASGANTPIILLGQMYSNDGGSGYRAINPRTASGMEEVAGTTGVSPQGHYLHYRQYNLGDTPANQTYDMEDEGQNIMHSCYVSFS